MASFIKLHWPYLRIRTLIHTGLRTFLKIKLKYIPVKLKFTSKYTISLVNIASMEENGANEVILKL